MRKPIVILGGMGPQASLRLQQLLLEKSRRYHSGAGEDYPHIVHFSLPVAEFLSDESQKAEAISTLRHVTPLIRELQPSHVLLACNTAHLLRDEVQLLQEPPFLSLLEVAAKAVAHHSVRRVGLLASPTTIRLGLYDDLLRQQGLQVVAPTKQQTKIIESAIHHIIAGKNTVVDRRQLADITTSLQARGAQAVLLGCTELPLVFDPKLTTLPVINCLEAYAVVTLSRYYLYNGEHHE